MDALLVIIVLILLAAGAYYLLRVRGKRAGEGAAPPYTPPPGGVMPEAPPPQPARPPRPAPTAPPPPPLRDTIVDDDEVEVVREPDAKLDDILSPPTPMKPAMPPSAPTAPPIGAPQPTRSKPPRQTAPLEPLPAAPPPPPLPTAEPPADDSPKRGISQDMIDRMREEDERPTKEDMPAVQPAGEVPPPPVAAPPDSHPTPPPELLGQVPPPSPQPRPTEEVPAAAEPVQFSTYYPKEVAPDQWEPLIAYLFKESAADKIGADAKQQLGPKLQQMRQVGETATQPIAEGTTVTATPTLEGFQVNPPSVSVGFFEDWHRFDFKVRAKTAPLNQAVNGMVTFTVEGVIVADVPISIFVAESVTAPAGESSTQTATVKPYDAIFCSYSRKDKTVVERVERAYKILGHEFMRDMISIRSGEQWSDALERLINRADIFQLFWSSTSSKSEHVAMEWRYALQIKDNKPANFIRPVYWEQPMPPVPDTLSSIHFAFEPTLDDE